MTSTSSESPYLLLDANTPRPPVVPGESKICLDETSSSENKKSRKHRGSPTRLVPRKSSLQPTETLSELNAPLGFEPEGGSCEPEPLSNESGSLTPIYLQWASNLNILLNDEDGLNLFRRYLEQEDQDRFNMLEFWLACKGLSNQPPKQAHQLVKVIYTHLFLKAQLGIGKDLRKVITQRIIESKTNNTLLPVTIFDDACKQVETVMTEVMYPNFLQSDLYINYIQKIQVPSDSDNESVEKSPKSCASDEIHDNNCVSVVNEPLPVVDEEKELSLPPALTRDALLATQRRRFAMRKHPESCSGRYLQYGSGTRYINPYHSGRRLHHSSYNPVSRQDSELQSLSSDARTDSMSDVSFDDVPSGRDHSHHSLKKQSTVHQHHHHHKHHQKPNVILNQNPDSYYVIPRTQRVQDVEKQKGQLDVTLLSKKLEDVLRERQKNDDERLPFDYSSADDILDQHVSRSIRDQTPKGSPSPIRTKSPENRKVPTHLPINKFPVPISGPNIRVLHPYAGTGPNKRKDKDVCSMFSSDSGNGTDLAEGSEHQRYTLSKSKSMPDYSGAVVDPLQTPDMFVPAGFYPRSVNRTWSSSRKTLTDSGVSVISGSHHEIPPSQQPHQFKEKFVASWLNESDRIVSSSTGAGSHSALSGERESNSSSKHRKSISGSHSRSKTGAGDRTMSMMSGGGSGRNNTLPAQPFVADPSMPPLPLPHTDTQLEEARRRLIEEQRDQCKPRYGQSRLSESHVQQQQLQQHAHSLKMETAMIQKSGGTVSMKISKCNSSSGNSASNEASSAATIVIYNFRGEEVPYRSTVPGNPITLKQFKEHIPRKGNYRYFFTTACEDLEMKQIKEEITDDNQFLPLWKGRVMAHIETMD